MSKFDLRNLDTSNPGGWPSSVKVFFCAVLAILILFLGWYFFVKDQQETLDNIKRTEMQLRAEFKDKQERAVNLEPLKQQLARTKERGGHERWSLRRQRVEDHRKRNDDGADAGHAADPSSGAAATNRAGA